MFTGLIEQTGLIQDIAITNSGAKISFCANFDDVKLGDSIAVNGVCLSITEIKNNIFSADVMQETLNLTNLKKLKKGDIVNLERAMKANSRLDGHLVSGHIDCCAKVQTIINEGFSKKITFSCDTSLIILKGSIAINGVSLTVSSVDENTFEVSLIPTTQEETNLKYLKIGDIVNIEYDLIGKYIQKFVIQNTKKEPNSKITEEFLKEHGF